MTLCILFSCRQSEKTMTDVPIVTWDCNHISSIHDAGLIRDVDILKLDCKEAIFEEIDKIIKHKKWIYLMDKQKTRSVFVYDTLGNFVNSISTFGQGPKEYLQMTDIFVDSNNSTLNIVSRIDKKILQYTLDGDSCIGIRKLPKSFWSLSPFQKKYIGYMGNYGEDRSKPFNLWSLNQDLELEDGYFEIPSSWESQLQSGGYVFSYYQGDLLFIKSMDYNIYSAEKNFKPKYSLDFGKSNWPDFSDSYDQMLERLRQMKYVNRLHYFQETTHFLLGLFTYKGQDLLGIYDKEEQRNSVLQLEPCTNPYFLSFGKIIGMDEEAIYSLVRASDVKRSWTGKDEYNDFTTKYPTQIKRLREKFKDVDENGNPFLLIHYIK